MSDRDDDKIVSLDQRRREDAARQKAEIAAAAKRAPANGSGRGINPSFGRPLPTRAANSGGPTPIASGIGTVLGWLVWVVAVAALALMAWGMISGATQKKAPEIPAEQLQAA